jgi:hypothetical protein
VVPSDFIRKDLAPLMHEVIDGHLCHAELDRIASEASSIDLESCVANISAVQNAVAHHAAAATPPPISMLMEMELALSNANESIKRLMPLVSQFRAQASDSMAREIALRSSMGAKLNDVMRSARGTVVHRGPLATSMFHLRAITEKSKRSANGK